MSRRLRILTWHVHGNYLYYLSQVPHDFLLVTRPGYPPGYAGVGGQLPWGGNVREVPYDEVPRTAFDGPHGFGAFAQLLHASIDVGIARAAFEFAVGYSKERVQFGVPIAMHQAIQFMIADMATKIEAARLLVWKSGALLDQGQRNTLVASHAKRFAADTAMEVATDAVQIYGGYGFIKEYPVEKLMRDAKIMQLYEGTSQIQRLVIAREVLMPRRVEEPDKAPAAA